MSSYTYELHDVLCWRRQLLCLCAMSYSMLWLALFVIDSLYLCAGFHLFSTCRPPYSANDPQGHMKNLLYVRPLSIKDGLVRHLYHRGISRLNDLTNSRDTERIVSESNAKVKLMRSLRLKKARDETQLLLLEGHRLIIDALQHGRVAPEMLLYTDRALQAPLGAALQEELLHHRGCSHLVSEDVFQSLSETVTSQGVVGAFHKPLWSSLTVQGDIANDQQRKLLVVLDGLSDPGNMGTLIRSGYGLGVDGFILVGGCDAWSPKVIRAAMGMNLYDMPVVEWTWDEVSLYVKRLEASVGSVQIVVADASDDNIPYRKIDFTQHSIIVIGSEATGVSDRVFHLPGTIIQTRIPMMRSLESFNAAIAGSVIIAEASMQRRQD